MNEMKPLLFHTASACVNAILANSPEANQALGKLQEHHKEPAVKTALKNKDLRFNKDLQIVPIGVHGGSREGSGRKAVHGKTIVKRIPDRYKLAVEALIKHLDDTRGQDGKEGIETKVSVCNLNDTLITLRFQSTSKKSNM
jgi:hypothetical protein